VIKPKKPEPGPTLAETLDFLRSGRWSVEAPKTEPHPADESTTTKEN